MSPGLFLVCLFGRYKLLADVTAHALPWIFAGLRRATLLIWLLMRLAKLLMARILGSSFGRLTATFRD